MRYRSFLAAMILAHLVTTVCFAEETEDGGALFEQARFDEAAAFFRRALQSFESSTEELATAYAYLAAIALVRGDDAEAVALVANAVALDGGVRCPAGAPLRLEGLIEEASSSRPRGMSLDVEFPERPVAGGSIRVAAELTGAPDGLVSSIRLECVLGGGETFRSRTGGYRTVVDVPARLELAGQPLACTATAHVDTGAVVRMQRAEVTLAGPTTAVPPPLTEETESIEESRSRRRRIGLGVGLGVGGVVVAVAVALGVAFAVGSDEADVGGVVLETR